MMADLQSPDPRCLKLHTAVCRVARLSDVVGYLDAYDREQTGPMMGLQQSILSRGWRMLHST